MLINAMNNADIFLTYMILPTKFVKNHVNQVTLDHFDDIIY